MSHWRGELPTLTIDLDWAYRRFDHLFGVLRYHGKPIYGYDATRSGTPLDTHGRNIYVDTFDSAYGRGWFRENAFLVHRPTGAFCYGFYPHGSRPPGKGLKYRATVIGPGVTPDLFWLGARTTPAATSRRTSSCARWATAAAGRTDAPSRCATRSLFKDSFRKVCFEI